MDNVSDLKHHKADIKNGGQVVILNTGAVITPEDSAMLQALYSRSPASVFEHLDKLAKVGSGKFMEKFYVGYGHRSIGDCGDTVIFIEGVSMLAAKAIQDWMLYSGQECSTRYLDFGTQRFINPFSGTPNETWAGEILERWRDFYVTNLPKVKNHIASRFPKTDEEKDPVYDKAISARAFDVMRSFLPAGASTSLSWTTNLRQAADKLIELRHHPLSEVRNIAEAIDSALKDSYPNSFNHKQYDSTESYVQKWMTEGYLRNFSEMTEEMVFSRNGIDKKQLAEYREFLGSRPAKTDLPKKIARTGTCQFRFLLDFGSFRDIQRHRAVVQEMPLLTVDHGFERWYLEELPSDIRSLARGLLDEFELDVKNNPRALVDIQYVIPMGYRVSCEISGDIPALVYLAELRSGAMVHPTLRLRAQELADLLEKEFGDCGLVLHIDKTEVDRFDAKRGSQDIIEKK